MINSKEELVLVDFGISSKFHDDDDFLTTTQGTMRFYAPEIVRTGVKIKVVRGRQTDIWAAGVTLFMLASNGAVPFDAKTIYTLQD